MNSSLKASLEEGNSALESIYKQLYNQPGNASQARHAINQNRAHALERLTGKGGFVDQISALPDAEQQVAFAEKFILGINRDAKERKSSTAMQQAFVSRFVEKLRETADTVFAMPFVNGQSVDFSDTAGVSTVKATLRAELPEALDISHASAVKPAAVAVTEAKSAGVILQKKNVEAAIMKAFESIAPTASRIEKIFYQAHASKGYNAGRISEEFNCRLGKATDFLITGDKSVANRLARAQSVGQMQAVLEKVEREAPEYGKTMKPVIDAYIKAFTETLGVSEPHFFSERLASRDR